MKIYNNISAEGAAVFRPVHFPKGKKRLNSGGRRIKSFCAAVLASFAALSLSGAIALTLILPSSVSVWRSEPLQESIGLPFITLEAAASPTEAIAEGRSVTTGSVCAMAFGSVKVCEIELNVFERLELIPGGTQFGISMHSDGVIIIGMADIDTPDGPRNPAYEAGLRVKDVIISVGGKTVTSASEVSELLSGGSELSVTVLRGGVEYTFSLTPVYSVSENRLKAGIWIRDGAAGIGTITYINPADNSFGGLGHGVCDADTGELLPLAYGTVNGVALTDITRGQAGIPGELSGYFTGERTGVLTANTGEGIFGIFNELPDSHAEALPISLRDEITEGSAQIIATDGAGGTAYYDVNILSIDRSGRSSRNFIIEVTDPALLELTGGIVQGMSGSPVIQNGCLVGAVTHVMINDPTRGYGIFIENMLKASEAQ